MDPHEHSLAGIFTTKDVCLRVLAQGLDPATTSIVRVMTPRPDTASEDMTVKDALRKMHGMLAVALKMNIFDSRS